jgi:ABC-2 type transport system ATP-binding protein
VLTTHYLEEAEALCGRIAMLKQGRVVALDTTQNLLRKHSGCYVDLRLSPDVLPEALMPVAVSHADGGCRLALKDYAQLEEIMAAIRVAGIKAVEMEVVQPDLEEVFVQIMQKA